LKVKENYLEEERADWCGRQSEKGRKIPPFTEKPHLANGGQLPLRGTVGGQNEMIKKARVAWGNSRERGGVRNGKREIRTFAEICSGRGRIDRNRNPPGSNSGGVGVVRRGRSKQTGRRKTLKNQAGRKKP